MTDITENCPSRECVAVSGAGGLIGAAVVQALRAGGWSVRRLVRRSDSGPVTGTDEIAWDPATGDIETQKLADCHAVIHLAGESISGLWTTAKRRRIYDSRVGPTQRLAAAVARLDSRPMAFLCASAVGFYGDCGDRVVTEQEPSGAGFLADLCRDWEAACTPAAATGTRVVNLRFGLVLAARGGVLARILPAFRMGLGGALGSGEQHWPWITLNDAARAILHVLEDQITNGPVNIASPEPATNAQFTQALAKELRRPAVCRVPAFALRMLPGDFARQVVLASTRAMPARLLANGFQFTHPTLAPALHDILK